MGYFLVKLYNEYVIDWNKSYEIVTSFLNQKGVKGYSYNLYFGGNELLAHIAVRFNFEKDEEGKQAIEKLIDNLIEKKLVTARGEWTPFMTTPSVVKGTEVATKCALAFMDWMNKNQEILKSYLNNPIEFTSRFLVILLQQLGFKGYFEEYPLDSATIELIRDCAKHCSSQVKEDFSQKLDIDFMERVVHHFLNCIHIDTGRTEPAIRAQIAHWEWLGTLLERKAN
jgi:hypothetical protein